MALQRCWHMSLVVGWFVFSRKATPHIDSSVTNGGNFRRADGRNLVATSICGLDRRKLECLYNCTKQPLSKTPVERTPTSYVGYQDLGQSHENGTAGHPRVPSRRLNHAKRINSRTDKANGTSILFSQIDNRRLRAIWNLRRLDVFRRFVFRDEFLDKLLGGIVGLGQKFGNP